MSKIIISINLFSWILAPFISVAQGPDNEDSPNNPKSIIETALKKDYNKALEEWLSLRGICNDGTTEHSGISSHQEELNILSHKPKYNKRIKSEATLRAPHNLMSGRDRSSLTDFSEYRSIDTNVPYKTKRFYAYRVVARDAIDDLYKTGKVRGEDPKTVRKKGEIFSYGNDGTDWYKGKAAMRYGRIPKGSIYGDFNLAKNKKYIIEKKLQSKRFLNQGNMLSGEEKIYHLKSYGKSDPFSIDEIVVYEVDFNQSPPTIQKLDMKNYKTGEMLLKEMSLKEKSEQNVRKDNPSRE